MPTIFGEHEPATLRQLHAVASHATRTALMADGHPGVAFPNGAVAAYRGEVSLFGVGFDIACGTLAVRTTLHESIFGDGDARTKAIGMMANAIEVQLTFGIAGTNWRHDAPSDHPLFDDSGWLAVPVWHRDRLRSKARRQLGTIGSGNHYVDVLADEEGRVWVAVHFGSRGLGHDIAHSVLAIAHGGRWGERGRWRDARLDLQSPLGDTYWTLMTLAGRYATAGREWVARTVATILGGDVVETVHTHHNFAWKEVHDDEEVVVVRNGASPAFPGQRSFIGGSMGDDAVIVQGAMHAPNDADPDLRRAALFSTVHGAGRVVSRRRALGRAPRSSLRSHSGGAITYQMMHAWVQERCVALRGGDVDEAPQAYRRLWQVLAAQRGTIDVLHTLRPLIVVMADPHK